MTRCLSPFASAEERFLPRVDRSGGPDACWPWHGTKSHDGYGMFHVNGRATYAHRFAWERAHGPAGALCVLHRCDNPPCCNPAHLFLGTRGDNVRDAASKGRLWAQARPQDLARGEAHHQAKLTAGEVIEIRARAAYGESQRALAREFRVDRAAIRNVIQRKTWRHVP
jgi:hypothetical protein